MSAYCTRCSLRPSYSDGHCRPCGYLWRAEKAEAEVERLREQIADDLVDESPRLLDVTMLERALAAHRREFPGAYGPPGTVPGVAVSAMRQALQAVADEIRRAAASTATGGTGSSERERDEAGERRDTHSGPDGPERR
jgi:hypothetical protein